MISPMSNCLYFFREWPDWPIETGLNWHVLGQRLAPAAGRRRGVLRAVRRGVLVKGKAMKLAKKTRVGVVIWKLTIKN